ncbi:GNAT family N-acetyltransferase [Tsuneonella amylolytica]|uniref:GNAT family N-acetyltransferase n=1 Tax=Tsuneonella amylolytica TaxID=2338327 RepID=UPI001F1D923A|nr:GNAT family N-acetyltransferase [Tsuneonella amylolytica]
MSILLRPATPDDVTELVGVGRQTFIDAFAHLYSESDLAAFLDNWRSPERIAANIAAPDTRVTVATGADGAIVAYCTTVFGKGFDERPEPRPEHPAFLSQLYCLGSETGRGTGAALIEDCLAEARHRGCDAVQLSVWAENYGAQRFYARYGFAKVADIDFWVGDHRDDEFLLELPLTAA